MSRWHVAPLVITSALVVAGCDQTGSAITPTAPSTGFSTQAITTDAVIALGPGGEFEALSRDGTRYFSPDALANGLTVAVTRNRLSFVLNLLDPGEFADFRLGRTVFGHPGYRFDLSHGYRPLNGCLVGQQLYVWTVTLITVSGAQPLDMSAGFWRAGSDRVGAGLSVSNGPFGIDAYCASTFAPGFRPFVHQGLVPRLALVPGFTPIFAHSGAAVFTALMVPGDVALAISTGFPVPGDTLAGPIPTGPTLPLPPPAPNPPPAPMPIPPFR